MRVHKVLRVGRTHEWDGHMSTWDGHMSTWDGHMSHGHMSHRHMSHGHMSTDPNGASQAECMMQGVMAVVRGYVSTLGCMSVTGVHFN